MAIQSLGGPCYRQPVLTARPGPASRLMQLLAWEPPRNGQHATISWQFTVDDVAASCTALSFLMGAAARQADNAIIVPGEDACP